MAAGSYKNILFNHISGTEPKINLHESSINMVFNIGNQYKGLPVSIFDHKDYQITKFKMADCDNVK